MPDKNDITFRLAPAVLSRISLSSLITGDMGNIILRGEGGGILEFWASAAIARKQIKCTISFIDLRMSKVSVMTITSSS